MTDYEFAQTKRKLKEYEESSNKHVVAAAILGLQLAEHVDELQSYIEGLEKAYTSMSQSLSYVNEELNRG